MTKRSTTEEFVAKAIIKHGEGTYDYSLVEYKTAHIKVKIICPLHGVFTQSPNHHLQGLRCRECGGTMPSNTAAFVRKAREKHVGERTYDYSLVEYVSAHTKVKIICRRHGVYEQTPHNHLCGQGCPDCGDELISESKIYTRDDFIIVATKKHGSKWCYDKVVYVKSNVKVIIGCPKHGDFEQTPNHHVGGEGCPECSRNISEPEVAWLNSLGIPNDTEHRQVRLPGMGRRSVDGFDPDTNTAYEFHGDYFHGSLSKFAANEMNKKVNKTFGQLYQETIEKESLIRSLGYNLIVMWESDWKKIMDS